MRLRQSIPLPPELLCFAANRGGSGMTSEAEKLVQGFVDWFDCKRKRAPVKEAKAFLERQTVGDVE